MRKSFAIAAVGVIVLATALAALLMLRPEITGHAVAAQTTAFLTVTGQPFAYNCNLTLVTGWNLISLPCRMDDMSTTRVLENLTGQYVSLHSYDESDTADPWKSFNPSLPPWVEQDLSVLDEWQGYWILLLNDTSLNITGIITPFISLTIQPGWNLIGYPSNKTQTPAEAFASINSSIASVHAYDASDTADYWKVYASSLPPAFHDLALITPYLGYWINATAQADWYTPLQ